MIDFAEPLLTVRNLVKHFSSGNSISLKRKKRIQAVNGISFEIGVHETLALVGESGSGKSTAGRCIVRLIEPTSGEIYMNGQDLTSLTHPEMRDFRRKIQFVFQDPYASLTPHLSAAALIMEPLKNYHVGTRTEQKERAVWLSERVGVRSTQLSKYPHEFSGGQRQRICIARALALNPELLILDEPVSALDVSIQAQVINLLMDLQSEFSISSLFISHDLSVVRHISNRIAVMYRGFIVELAITQKLFNRPAHPYTRALLSSIPQMDPNKRNQERIILEGDVPSASEPIIGCPFKDRCPKAKSICTQQQPPLEQVEEGHLSACHFNFD
jgi:peptide/nickel transport system ATP-binding protein